MADSGERGRLRASQADRECVIDTLKAAFVQGQLEKDEFDARVDEALASRTYAGLAAVTGDIPTGPITAPSRQIAHIKASAGAITAGSVIVASGWLAAWSAHVGNAEIIVLLISLTVILSGAWLLTGLVLLECRSPHHLPAQPGSG